MSQSSTDTILETEFPVRYAETDAMGVVHHATYLVYFEEGRSQYMRDMGSDYANVEASGYQLPVTSTSLRFVGSLRYGDRVRVKTRIKENRSRRVTFAYEILKSGSDDILVSGETQHIWTDSENRVTRMPDAWKSVFGL